MSFWHNLGFHDWHFVAKINLIEPKCGAFDPRDDEERKYIRNKFICCICGATKLKPEPEIYYP